jgi:undecaprenyl phosphate-alpha-L-ara4N flippase subunit ArnF
MNSLVIITIVILLAAVGVFGDYFIKLSGNGPSYISYAPFFIGMLIYALTAVGWFYAMKHLKLGTLGVFYSLTTVILLVLVGVFFFKEQLNIYEIVGIVLGVISILILARFG